MNNIELTPNAATGGVALPAEKKGGRKQAASAAKTATKESRAEEIVHELFRLAHVDLRASAHGKSLAAELAGLMTKGGNYGKGS